MHISVSSNFGFGNRLRLLRLSRELSQSELARAIDRHQTAIGPYERGEYMPARDVIEKLAQALGTSPEYLLFGRSPYRSQIEVGGSTGRHGIIPADISRRGSRPIALDESRLLAFRIDDRSMSPAFEPGDHALVQRGEPGSADELVSEIVLAELIDGRQVIRRLLPSAHIDLYDLAALSGPVWHDVSLRRVRGVLGCLRPGALGQGL